MVANDTRIVKHTVLVLFVIAAGCASDFPSGSDGNGTGGKDGGAGESAVSSDGSSNGPGPCDEASTPPGDDTSDSSVPNNATPIALPFHVSDQFIPSGFMGNSQPSMDGMKLSVAAADCKS